MPYLGRSPGTGVRSRYIYTATASQTTFSGADDNGATLAYMDGTYVDVFLNGVLLKPVTDYAATTKTSVVLTSGAAVSDIIEIVAYDIASVADTVSRLNGGEFGGTITAPTIKVNTIQTAAGGVPTAADLGLNVTGTVLQIVTARPTTTTTFSSADFTDAAGFSVTITPKFSNSLILINIMAQTSMDNTTVNTAQTYKLLRDSTQLVRGNWVNYLNRADYSSDFYPPFVLYHQDSPATTSSIVYKLQGSKYNSEAANGSWTINDANGGYGGSYGLMTVAEIAQ